MSEDMTQLEELNQSESPAEKNSEANDAPDDWQQLDGRSQDRFKRLAQQKKELLAEKQRLEQDIERYRNTVPMPNSRQTKTEFASEDEKLAFNRLTNELGVPTQDKVQSMIREEVENAKSRLYLDNWHDRLEKDISTNKDLPSYDRAEVEDYMRSTGIMNPKVAYEQLYRDEVIAHEAQKLNSKKKETVQTGRTSSRNGVTEPWTRERLQERLRQPDGLEFYRKNQEKILRLQSELGKE
jgi:hypothetical protein